MTKFNNKFIKILKIKNIKRILKKLSITIKFKFFISFYYKRIKYYINFIRYFIFIIILKIYIKPINGNFNILPIIYKNVNNKNFKKLNIFL